MPKPATPADPKVEPNPALEKRSRRTFTTEYKLSIIQQADACQHGELGELLRRKSSIPISCSSGVESWPSRVSMV